MLRLISVLAPSVFAVACGGSEPTGSLIVNLLSLPDFTAESDVEVAGSVTRTPPKPTSIVVSVAGGRNTVIDTVDAAGSFFLRVLLNTNQENQLAITASDETGAVSTPIVAVVRHDDTGPALVSLTPPSGADSVLFDTPIEARFAEPLVAVGATPEFVVTQNGRSVPGTWSLSGDAMQLTFLPDDPLEPNSIYELRFDDFTDEAGNAAGTNMDACFITTSEGFVDAFETDSVDLGWAQGTPPATLRPADIEAIRWARNGTTLSGVVEFASERVFDLDSDDNAIVLIEIDADQDGSTGFVTLKDTVFTSEPDFASGLGAEFVVGLEPNPGLADSAYVGVFTDPLIFDAIDVFLPGICGEFYGFHTTTLLDAMGDDGNFDYTVLTFAIDAAGAGNWLDPMPDGGHFTLSFASAPPGPALSLGLRSRSVGRSGRIHLPGIGTTPRRTR